MRLLSVGLLLCSAAAFAQLAPQTPQTAYNGQNVSTVSLIANPHRDLTPLLPLVAHKAGTPYSQASIEATAQALKQAGGFPKVQVSVEPEVAGLRVNFLLEPAYYVNRFGPDSPGAC
jgi:outer membrane protein assembly factor BamA